MRVRVRVRSRVRFGAKVITKESAAALMEHSSSIRVD
jgi:hypothetical protein